MATLVWPKVMLSLWYLPFPGVLRCISLLKGLFFDWMGYWGTSLWVCPPTVWILWPWSCLCLMPRRGAFLSLWLKLPDFVLTPELVFSLSDLQMVVGLLVDYLTYWSTSPWSGMTVKYKQCSLRNRYLWTLTRAWIIVPCPSFSS